MKWQDELHQLIHALSKSEKRYVSLAASIEKGEKNYLRLFHLLARQKQYDEEEILKQFGGTSISRYLPMVKSYLYHLLLDAIAKYHAEATISNRLRWTLMKTDILNNKALVRQSRRLLNKAKADALKHEQYIQLMDILRIEKRIPNSLSVQIFREEEKTLKLMGNLTAYEALFFQAFEASRKLGTVRRQGEMSLIKQITRNRLLKTPSLALSAQAQLTYHNTLSVCHYLLWDFEQVYRHQDNRLKIMESRGWLLEDDQDGYLSAMANLLMACIETARHERFFSTLEKFRSIKPNSIRNEIRIFINSYVLEMNLYMKTGEYRKGVALVQPVLEGIKKYGERIDREQLLVIFDNIASVYFGEGDFAQALIWNNKVLNERESGLREDLHSMCRIRNLFIHLELKHFDLMEYVFRSTYSYLVRRERLYAFEKYILHFMRNRLPVISDNRNLISVLQDFKNGLEKVKKHSLEDRRVKDYSDFILIWLESKITGKPFAEIVRGKSSAARLPARQVSH